MGNIYAYQKKLPSQLQRELETTLNTVFHSLEMIMEGHQRRMDTMRYIPGGPRPAPRGQVGYIGPLPVAPEIAEGLLLA